VLKSSAEAGLGTGDKGRGRQPEGVKDEAPGEEGGRPRRHGGWGAKPGEPARRTLTCHRGNTAKLKAAAAPGRDRGGGERGKGSRRSWLRDP